MDQRAFSCERSWQTSHTRCLQGQPRILHLPEHDSAVDKCCCSLWRCQSQLIIALLRHFGKSQRSSSKQLVLGLCSCPAADSAWLWHIMHMLGPSSASSPLTPTAPQRDAGEAECRSGLWRGTEDIHSSAAAGHWQNHSVPKEHVFLQSTLWDLYGRWKNTHWSLVNTLGCDVQRSYYMQLS